MNLLIEILARPIPRFTALQSTVCGLMLVFAQGKANAAQIISIVPTSCQRVCVQMQERLITIHVVGGSWNQLLPEIERRTGVSIHHNFAQGDSVSVSITAIPLEAVFYQLLSEQWNYMLRYTVDEITFQPRVTEVWVLGLKNDYPDRSPLTRAASGALLHIDSDTADIINEEDLALLQHRNPAVRAQKLASLTKTKMTDKLRYLVDTARADKSAIVRGAAYQLLANDKDPESVEQLHQALYDPDPGVRILALESVDLDQAGKEILESALSDPDETVRGMAAQRLRLSE